nr:YceO family protein [Enterobacter hormaechei]
MRRLVNYRINNSREHFMRYIFLWSLLAIVDDSFIVFF